MPQGQVQQRNADMVRLLSADLQTRYDATFAWSRAVSAHLALPGLRGFWPMSAVNSFGQALDLSGNALPLGYNGNPTYNYAGLAPYIALDGTGDYLSRADAAALDITGTETYIAAAARGLTFGGWFWFDVIPQDKNVGILGKYNTTGNQRSYLIYTGGTDYPVLVISPDGSGGIAINVAGAGLSTGAWHFLVGRVIPSTEASLYQDGVWYRGVTSIPASVYNGTAPFQVGAFNAGSFLMTGRASLCFLCAASLSDAQVAALYGVTRPLFGV